MSTPFTLPVVKVTLLEDRALVERRGEVPLVPGAQRLVVSGLSPLAVDRSLQAKLAGGTVSQARVRRARKPQPPEALREHTTRLDQRVADLEQEERQRSSDVSRLTARQDLLTTAHADVYRAISEQAGGGMSRAETWKQQLDSVRQELEAAGEALRQAQREHLRVQHQLEEARRARAGTQQEEARLDVQAELEVGHPAGGTALLSVTYLVPCAAWRPAYRATLESSSEGTNTTVRLECEAVVWQRTEEEWKDVELAFSTARPTLGAAPPRLETDWLFLRDKTDREKQVVEVAVREEVIQTAGEGGAAKRDEGLPGMDDGGEALTLAAPHRATVPSDGEPHRVPLFHFTAPAASELLVCPELSPLVHRVARFDNVSPAVLLAGPVDLVRQSGYVGRSQLRFTGKGERVRLGFGSEDSLRVARQTDLQEDVSRLTGRKVKTHHVRMFVSNMGPKPAAVALEERLPVSEVESVEVVLQKEATRPAPTRVSTEGIARFELTAPPRSQQELTLVYTVTSSSKVAGL
ncbi:hypothetical protein MYSTI_04532 [Myxococcus stipitatus DSM 14675]|uniref:Mucoidy inhibitor MuiA family protein n=1 Tax=Myxococcus stipitatus (strain DSM 14675 / JCM 12634 / Mx s8) TaxID=1278073 RepID=L7UH95_MYXSD|nr:mucoidy inhibitor MuiA family protein [Myxococcus stipitatus]AGC45824.1 hypothetical protein MYSTI_04532 [Myxococcus stipitatus DSM 14675]